MVDGKAHVDFPASSPYVLACGGTKLTASGNTILAEVVWYERKTSATGGGLGVADGTKLAGVSGSQKTTV